MNFLQLLMLTIFPSHFILKKSIVIDFFHMVYTATTPIIDITIELSQECIRISFYERGVYNTHVLVSFNYFFSLPAPVSRHVVFSEVSEQINPLLTVILSIFNFLTDFFDRLKFQTSKSREVPLAAPKLDYI